MTDNPQSTFARRVRAAKPRAKKYDVWDDVISGLGLRIGTGGHRSFFLRRSVRGRIRSATIGDADTLSVPQARAEARKLLATFIEPARKDDGPRTLGHPMPAFAEEFLERQARLWKPRTVTTNAHAIRNHILPAFAHMTVDAIAAGHVRDWFASMAERPGSANRAMPVLSTMMRMAELWGYRPHNSNPCKNAKRYRMKPRERYLSAEEMARLNAVLKGWESPFLGPSTFSIGGDMGTYPDEIRWERFPRIAALPEAKQWLEIQSLLGLADNTVEAYGRGLEDFLRWCAGSLVIAGSAGRDNVARYVADLHQRRGPRGDIDLVAPARPPKGAALGRLTLEDFILDEEGLVLRCPNNVEPVSTSLAQAKLQARFDLTICRACSDKDRCPVQAAKRDGQFARFQYTPGRAANQKRRLYERSETFREIYRWRAGIEATMSRLKCQMNLAHLRIRGMPAMRYVVHLRALGLNICRCAAIGP